MKKSILLLALAVLALQGVDASTVSQQTAQTIATNFFKVTATSAATANVNASLSYTKTETDGTVDFYVFNISPMTGFVIVSASDAATPILGYSTESAFTSTLPAFAAINDWVASAGSRIHYAVTNNLQATATVQRLWASYAAGQNPNASRASTVGPLMTTTWNQNPYYNALCPPAATASTSSSKSVTGCVATTMAQIMKYWNYPAQGVGVDSFADNVSNGYSQNYGWLKTDMTRPLNWAAMPTNVSSNTSAVDSLMYELGVAVHMDYSPTGSGAYVLISETYDSISAEYRYIRNFHYNPHTIQGVHLASYTDADWITLMENEINAGRVVQYEGQDPTQGGHTWVMDGYQTSATAAGGALLHMNWGWGGYDDGYFDVTNLLTTNGGFNPSQNDAALIGIEPIPPFNLTVSPSPSICPGANGATLSVQGPANATYTWSPATGLSCTTCASPVANPGSTTLYTVTADSAGVTVTSSVAVTVASAVHAAFNYTVATSCNLPENVAFANTSTNATGYTWSFGDGTTSTATSPLHAYTAVGTYTASLYATNACGVDSLIRTQAIQITGGAPVVASQSICDGNSATLTAAGTGVNWYSDAAGTNLMQQGNSYTTPSLTSTITYYVGSSVSPAPTTAGPVSDGIGAQSEYTAASSGTTLRGDYFYSSVAQTLNSVVVYATGAGPRTFAIVDSATLTVIDSMTVSLISGQQTVQLGFDIPANQALLITLLGTTNMARNSTGAVFPYVSGDGTVTITNNNASAPGRFYFFYDWKFGQATCNSAIVPVSVYVLNAGGGTFTTQGTGNLGVNFTPSDLSATTYAWDFGDGSTSTQATVSHTYSSVGTYTVQLIESNGSCSDTITQTVSASVLGITDVTNLTTLSVSPNPAKNNITLNVNSAKNIGSSELMITNILGQTEYNSDIAINSGSNKINLDVTHLTAGMYFVTLQNGKTSVTAKFVKSDN